MRACRFAKVRINSADTYTMMTVESYMDMTSSVGVEVVVVLFSLSASVCKGHSIARVAEVEDTKGLDRGIAANISGR